MPGQHRQAPASLTVGIAAFIGAVAASVLVTALTPSPVLVAPTVPTAPAPVVSNVAPASTEPTFAQPVISDGLSITVLRPEKVKGGVRLTIAVANVSPTPVTVNAATLGPHGVRFNDAEVPMVMDVAAPKKLVPGEGYTYQCVIKLPNMDSGQLVVPVAATTVSGRAAGD